MKEELLDWSGKCPNRVCGLGLLAKKTIVPLK